MKRIIIYMCLFLLTGCDYKELSELSIGTVLGIDQSDKGYEVSCLVVGKEENKTLFYKGEGASMGSALTNLNLNLSEDLYLNHIQSVVLSSKVAKKGLKNILNYFLKEDPIQKNFYLFLTKDVDASDILKNLLETSGNDYNVITNLFKYHDQIKFSDQSDSFNEFLNDILSKKKEPTLHAITLNENKLGISDLGIFKNDRLVAFSKNAAGYATLTGNAKKIILEIPCKKNHSVVSVEQMKTGTKVKNSGVYNTITGQIKIKENGCHFQTKTKEDKNILQEKVQTVLHKVLDDSIAEGKKIGSDIFGYQELLYKKNPRIQSFSLSRLQVSNTIRLNTKEITDEGAYHE